MNPDHSRKVAALGVVIPSTKTTLLFDATPDITAQMHALNSFAGKSAAENPDAIFLTHAHIGHYTGLMYLGKEATNASEVRVFAMPRLANFLTANGPWSQLVSSKNIALNILKSDSSLLVTPNIEITPFLVPHRDEFSETVGYVINGPSKSALFIPDIDKWSKWERSIVDEIAKVDYAFIDGTFYDAVEINNRDISEIPHPFIIESMQLFDNMPLEEKQKIHFIHFNHTNPAVLDSSSASQLILSKGYNIARINSVFEL